MPTETITATPNWAGLEGRVLEGGYEIGECLISSPASASFKVRVLGDRFTTAIVNVFTAEATPPEQYALWSDAAELRHASLSSPITVGKHCWNGVFVPYVVLRKADENLAGVLKERALTAAEAGEVLKSALGGLQYLHSSGFVHSCLSPEEVLAIGDSIQLSTTGIRRINTPVEDGGTGSYQAPESGGENLTIAADVWCLGATLFEVLTQNKFGEDCRYHVEALPKPFDWIVERCVNPDPQTRCTVMDVRAMLRGEKVRPAPEAVPLKAFAAGAASAAGTASAAVPTLDPVAGAASVPRTQPMPRPEPRPSRSTESPRPRLAPTPKPVYTEEGPRFPRFAAGKPEESPRTKFLSYAFLAIVLAGGLLWLARPKPPRALPSTNASASSPVKAGVQQASAPVPGSQSRTVQPGETASTAAPATASPAVGPGEVWRVVAYTFARKEDAERSARALDGRHPGFGPEVIASSGVGGPFLVVLGGPMTSRPQADRLRQKARSSGFPRDSYVQNFSH